MDELKQINTFSAGLLPTVLLQGLATLRSQQEFCDVILKAGDSNYHAHKAVLASVSPFFR